MRTLLNECINREGSLSRKYGRYCCPVVATFVYFVIFWNCFWHFLVLFTYLRIWSFLDARSLTMFIIFHIIMRTIKCKAPYGSKNLWLYYEKHYLPTSFWPRIRKHFRQSFLPITELYCARLKELIAIDMTCSVLISNFLFYFYSSHSNGIVNLI